MMETSNQRSKVQFPNIPPGLDCLYRRCREIYNDQPNPLQVASVRKYWLGGPDPLDYISMYSNPGSPGINIPPHWHYVSFGLTDLHGDGRVHRVSGPNNPSGYGFELTFRLKREPDDKGPPPWPATIMQALARYVFQSGNILCYGDHVSWHCALDNSESRIQHMLMAEDPQLGSVVSQHGTVNFIQIVGVCKEELEAAQRWYGPGVIDLLKQVTGAGGLMLVTDMRRGESIFELSPNAQDMVTQGIEENGSHLSGVSARCSWTVADMNMLMAQDMNLELEGCLKEGPPTLKHSSDSDQIKAALESIKHNLNPNPVLPPIKAQSLVEKMPISVVGYDGYDEDPDELSSDCDLESLHLTFNLESAIILQSTVIRGRIMHGRHFTFKSVLGDTMITFVASAVTGAFVTCDKPYVVHRSWLQVLIPEDFVEEMAKTLEPLSDPTRLKLPKTFIWLSRKLAITVVPDGDVRDTRVL